MALKEQSDLLKRVLGLTKEPLAITFTNDEVSEGLYEKTTICRALKRAAEGACFVIDEKVETCPGGSRYCGFTDIAANRKRGLQRFLTKGEKLTSSIVTFERMLKLPVQPPIGLAERLVICPLEKTTLRPDIVMFQCNAEQACRLITLDTYWDGISPQQQVIGALCYSTIAYPVMTGCTNMSAGDWTARKQQGFEPDILFFSLPYERMHNLLEAIPNCSAGEAKAIIPEAFRRD